MPKDRCPNCKSLKDTRAKYCRSCRILLEPAPRETGKWQLDKNSGYMIKRINKVLVYQHRNTIETKLGRKLNTNEHIHHRDGNKSNNHLSNLEILSSSEHHRLHMLKDGQAKKLSILAHKARWGYTEENL